MHKPPPLGTVRYLVSFMNVHPASRPKKGFTLLELIVVVVILALLALLAAPSFVGVINESTSETGLRTAETIARNADALAVFNQDSATNETSFTNIQEATLEADLDPADGWAFEINSGLGGSHVALTKNGSTLCWSITVDATQTPDRAIASELFDTTVSTSPPCPNS